jgi:hypothetical protein
VNDPTHTFTMPDKFITPDERANLTLQTEDPGDEATRPLDDEDIYVREELESDQ